MEKSARIRMYVLVVLFLSVAWAGDRPPEAADSVADILEGIRESYGGLQGLSVPYTREVITRSMAMMGTQAKGDLAEGRIYFKPPHFLRLEQDTPKQEVLITDGTTLWWYVPEENRAYRYDRKSFGRELELLSDLFRGLREADDRFRLTLISAAQEGTELELRPEPPWEQVDRIVVRLDGDHVIRGVDIHNLLGGITRFRLGAVTERTSFEPGFFHFVAPEGVEVVDGAVQ